MIVWDWRGTEAEKTKKNSKSGASWPAADGVGAAGAGLLLAWCGCGADVVRCSWCVDAGVAVGVAIVQDKSKINFALQIVSLNICLLNYFAPNEDCTVIRLFQAWGSEPVTMRGARDLNRSRWGEPGSCHQGHARRYPPRKVYGRDDWGVLLAEIFFRFSVAIGNENWELRIGNRGAEGLINRP